MVFFNCNSCGEALKKNQVEKHYQFKCKNCNVLSCVDCQKEFWGDAYKEHTKCISEEEKYSGKNWKPKANANKGEQKQEAWTQQVIAAISKCPAGKPRLKDLLKKIEDYPNIPRKKAKFENFVKNSMRVREDYLIAEAWNILSAEINKPAPAQEEPKQNGNSEKAPTKAETTSDAKDTSEEPTAKKLSKRERKEERQKKQHKADKKRKKSEEAKDDENDEDGEKSHKKRGKKRSRDEDEPEVEETTEEPKKKKKKKKKDKLEDIIEEEEVTEEIEEVEPQRTFCWETCILEILQKSADQEISMKKMKKKILAEFHSSGGDGKTYTEEKLLSRLNKHILRNPRLKIHKERVRLLS